MGMFIFGVLTGHLLTMVGVVMVLAIDRSDEE